MNETTYKFMKIWSRHTNLVFGRLSWIKDTALSPNCHSSNEIVTSDHPNSHTSLVALFDGHWDLFPDNILDTGDADEGHVTFFNFVNSASLIFFVVFFTTFVLLEVFVSKANGPES